MTAQGYRVRIQHGGLKNNFLRHLEVLAEIPVMAVNTYKRKLVSLLFREHFMVLHASTRHVIKQINDERQYNCRQPG